MIIFKIIRRGKILFKKRTYCISGTIIELLFNKTDILVLGRKYSIVGRNARNLYLVINPYRNIHLYILYIQFKNHSSL